jgi:non-canonical poly(A) RNA polymerase PAPD5/7
MIYRFVYAQSQTGISVRKGGFYFSKAHRGWQRERQPYLLSIEDPADES